MLNRSGITKTTYGNVNQILANVELQSSVGCRVPNSVGVIVGDKTIAKAGTPIHINLDNLSSAVAAASSAAPMNAVLLHDVDVTSGTANGTALIFGFVNLNRIDSDIKTKITTARAVSGITQLITFMTV